MEPSVPIEVIEGKILLIRGQKVMLDAALAELYGVSTKALKQAVGRNTKRFPDDFMFLLTIQEVKNLRSQFVTSSGWGGVRYAPMAFGRKFEVAICDFKDSTWRPPVFAIADMVEWVIL